MERTKAYRYFAARISKNSEEFYELFCVAPAVSVAYFNRGLIYLWLDYHGASSALTSVGISRSITEYAVTAVVNTF